MTVHTAVPVTHVQPVGAPPIAVAAVAAAKREARDAKLSANRERWAEQSGRFVPNLLRILNDSLWEITPRVPAVSAYQDAETYLQRVANE